MPLCLICLAQTVGFIKDAKLLNLYFAFFNSYFFMANRHLLRTVAMQALFEWDFNNKQEDLKQIVQKMLDEFAGGVEDSDFATSLALGVKDNLQEIDGIITQTAPEWPIDQITVVDRNVLRVGIYELMFLKDVPPKVAINEAVEMGKVFAGGNSGKFVNGVLGTLYKKMSGDESGEDSEPAKE